MDIARLWDKNGEMDVYAVLKVSPLSDQETIRKAWIDVCKTEHPDLHGGRESQWWLMSKEAHRILTQEKVSYDMKRGLRSAAVVADGFFKVAAAFASAATVVVAAGIKLATGTATETLETGPPTDKMLLPVASKEPVAEEPIITAQPAAETAQVEPPVTFPVASKEPAAEEPTMEQPAAETANVEPPASLPVAPATGVAPGVVKSASAAIEERTSAEQELPVAPVTGEVTAEAPATQLEDASSSAPQEDRSSLTPEEVDSEDNLRASAAKVLTGARRLREKARRLRTLLDQS